MTTEQAEYGAGWAKCTRCKVSQAARHLKDGVCIDAKQCSTWIIELAAKASGRPLAAPHSPDPLAQLRIRGVAALELEYNHRKANA